MTVVLNILAALVLTVLPALKPCDCNGFSFVCACALNDAQARARAHASNSAQDEIEPSCCCCRKSKATRGDSGHAPEQPVPRKHGDCLKFAVYHAELAAADPVPLGCETLHVEFLPAPAVHFAASLAATPMLHYQRPPPFGLIVVLTRYLRI